MANNPNRERWMLVPVFVIPIVLGWAVVILAFAPALSNAVIDPLANDWPLSPSQALLTALMLAVATLLFSLATRWLVSPPRLLFVTEARWSSLRSGFGDQWVSSATVLAAAGFGFAIMIPVVARPVADLEVAIEDPIVATHVGEALSAAIMLTNTGPSTANAVAVKVESPGWEQLAPAPPKANFDGDVWLVGKVEPGVVKHLQLTGRAAAAGPHGLMVYLIATDRVDPDSEPTAIGQNVKPERRAEDDEAYRRFVVTPAPPPMSPAVAQVRLQELPDHRCHALADVPPITFGFNVTQHRLIDSQQRKILAVIMAETRWDSLVVLGFADSVGDPGYNLQISEARARSVAEMLVSYGDNEPRLTRKNIRTIGLGEGRDVPNDDPGLAPARRVEILHCSSSPAMVGQS